MVLLLGLRNWWCASRKQSGCLENTVRFGVTDLPIDGRRLILELLHAADSAW